MPTTPAKVELSFWQSPNSGAIGCLVITVIFAVVFVAMCR